MSLLSGQADERNLGWHGPCSSCSHHMRPHPLSPLQVGAALSMVYTSGAPIMFVGCGQTYVDLKKLHVKSVVKSLLK